MNLEGKLNLIKNAVTAIKNAILGKGVTPSGNLSTYADAIEQIDTVNNTSLTVNPSTTSQTLRPSSSYTGYDVVTVNPVTSAIDSDIVSTNIKSGANILGVNGSVVELSGQTKTITENGTYTPDSGYNGFTEVVVNTPIGINREVESGVYQIPNSSSFTFSLPSNAHDVGDYALYYAFKSSYGLTSVDLSNLTTLYGTFSFYGAFYGCINLISINLSNLYSIFGYGAMMHAFENCKNLTNVNLSRLTTLEADRCFADTFTVCTSLSSLSFPSLMSSSFGLNTNQFYNMLNGVTGCTVHFPSNLQSVIGNWSDVINGFGGTNTTVLFDLPATI